MVFSCGPAGFMESTKSLLQEMDYNMNFYQEESFGSGAKKGADTETVTSAETTVVEQERAGQQAAEIKTDSDSSNEIPVIHFLRSEIEIFGSEMDLSILDIAEELDIDIPSSCQAGTCGTCKVIKKCGNIEYESEPEGLDEAEVQEGYILTCISTAKDFVEIEA